MAKTKATSRMANAHTVHQESPTASSRFSFLLRAPAKTSSNSLGRDHFSMAMPEKQLAHSFPSRLD